MGQVVLVGHTGTPETCRGPSVTRSVEQVLEPIFGEGRMDR